MAATVADSTAAATGESINTDKIKPRGEGIGIVDIVEAPGLIRTADSNQPIEVIASINLAETTTACEKALAIPHILKSIICHLHPVEITEARRVSTWWRTTIRSSKQIQIARTLRPTSTYPYFHTNFDACCVPLYTTPRFSINRAFDKNTIGAFRNGPIMEELRKLSEMLSNPNIVRRQLDEFVTSPRCSAVQVDMHDSYINISLDHRVVVVPHGVRIRDVVQAARAMLKWPTDEGWGNEVHVAAQVSWLKAEEAAMNPVQGA